jgi:tetratricopeptide (TPR) repeat protein
MLFAVRLVDLSAIKALDLTGASNAEIAERLRQDLDFLPKGTRIEVTDGIVTIDIPDSAIGDKSEADRLHVRATQRAKQGDYRKAVGIWERVIELDPANVEARRNLGMACIELQETDITQLRLLPTRSASECWLNSCGFFDANDSPCDVGLRVGGLMYTHPNRSGREIAYGKKNRRSGSAPRAAGGVRDGT